MRYIDYGFVCAMAMLTGYTVGKGECVLRELPALVVDRRARENVNDLVLSRGAWGPIQPSCACISDEDTQDYPLVGDAQGEPAMRRADGGATGDLYEPDPSIIIEDLFNAD